MLQHTAKQKSPAGKARLFIHYKNVGLLFLFFAFTMESIANLNGIVARSFEVSRASSISRAASTANGYEEDEDEETKNDLVEAAMKALSRMRKRDDEEKREKRLRGLTKVDEQKLKEVERQATAKQQTLLRRGRLSEHAQQASRASFARAA